MDKRDNEKTKCGLRRTIERIGMEILWRTAVQKGSDEFTGPIMIPPIPDSKFIDKLPEGELEGPNIQEKDHQEAYEAEVKLFRRFEEIQDTCLVIHQLEFTHEQYSAFVNEHQCSKKQCKKGPEIHPCHKQKSEIEGECDFVLVGNNFVAVFEVKGLHFRLQDEDKNKFEGCCKSAILQRNKMKVLTRSLNSSMMFFQFTVFPNISLHEIKEGSYIGDGTLLFAEDLENLSSLIDACEEFSSPLTLDEFFIGVCLLGLWCLDQKCGWDVTSGDLTKCIKDIDEKLRRALVTRKSVDAEKTEKTSGRGKEKAKRKQYPENPEMVEAPKFVKDFLKLSCLTKPQLEAIESEERFLWVEGPAGAGKTFIMYAKIIDIVLNEPPERRILVILPGKKHHKAIQCHIKVLEKITTCSIAPFDYEMQVFLSRRLDLCHEELRELNNRVSAAQRDLSELLSKTKSRIVFLPMKGLFCESTMYSIIASFDHVFVDDYQHIAGDLTSEVRAKFLFFNKFDCPKNVIADGLYPVIKNSSNNNTNLWIFSDKGQTPRYQFICFCNRLYKKELFDNFKNLFASNILLTKNLRNTYEISTVLSVIRKHYTMIDLSGEESGSNTLKIPQQKQGHFLRGTKPTIHLVRDDRPPALGVFKELKNLTGPRSFFVAEDIGVTCHFDIDSSLESKKRSADLGNTIRKILRLALSITTRKSGDWAKIWFNHISNCVSAEWPAMIYIQRYTPTYYQIDLDGTRHDLRLDQPEWKSLAKGNDRTIPLLYLALSRARVHSTVFIYGYRRGIYEATDDLFDELRQRKDVCRVIDG